MFDLNQASEGNNGKQFQNTGIFDNVKVSEVVLEKTSKNQVSYMRLVTEGSNGEIGSSPKMFLSTDVKEGKKTSGWGVTARSLVDLLKATYNVTEEAAKAMMPNVNSEQELVQKVSTLLVGRPFRAKFKGTTNEKGYIYAELGQAESMRIEPTKMHFDATRDIKAYSGPVTVETSVSSTSDLPF